MRTALAVALGVVIGGVAVLGVVVALRPSLLGLDFDERGAAPDRTTVASSRTSAAPVSQSAVLEPAVADRAVAQPTKPTYDRQREEARSIYRCRSNGRTTYSNAPCKYGSVVDESNALAGFDSRPSAAMERLIAEGRAKSVDERSSSRVALASASPAPVQIELCASMRQQIVDIDNQMRLPNPQRTLDYWRQVRQDIRTSMARERC